MSVNTARATIRVGKTALLVCDIQERFAKAICGFNNIVANSARLVSLKFSIFEIFSQRHKPNKKILDTSLQSLQCSSNCG